MESYNSYQELLRPVWAPPAWLFGPVWTVLYIIIAITFTKVGLMYYRKQIPFKVALPFLLNLIFNFAFTPIQFGLKNNILASLDIVLVLVTLVWGLWSIRPYSQFIFYANIPYLLWVTFATILQFNITYLNL